MNLRLLSNRIAVCPDPKTEVSKGGIALLKDEKVNTGTIRYVGPGARTHENVLIPTEVKIGDRVTFLRGNEQEYKFNDEILYIMTEDEILSIIE